MRCEICMPMGKNKHILLMYVHKWYKRNCYFKKLFWELTPLFVWQHISRLLLMTHSLLHQGVCVQGLLLIDGNRIV